MSAPDNHYSDPALASLYDLSNGWGEDSEFYLSLAGQPCMAIVDVGCGTGTLCNAFAQHGHTVVGVDPVAAMLLEAAKKTDAQRIEWINSTAESFRCRLQFDLAVMTGHAFQVLLQPADVMAALNNIALHLKPGGYFVFESRNPQYDWAAEWHQRTTSYESPLGQIIETISVEHDDAMFIEFVTRYQIGVRELMSRSNLRFFTLQQISRLIEASDLKLGCVYGDWHRSWFTTTSKEMIFVVQK